MESFSTKVSLLPSTKRIRKPSKPFQIKITKNFKIESRSNLKEQYTLYNGFDSHNKDQLEERLRILDCMSLLPKELKSAILNLGHKMVHEDIDVLTRGITNSKNLDKVREINEMKTLFKQQKNKIEQILAENGMVKNRFPSQEEDCEEKCETKNIQSLQLERNFTKSNPLLLVQTNFEKRINLDDDSFENVKYGRKDSYCCETPSTTPSIKSSISPLFAEKKNLLLSTKIEDIIDDGFDVFCKKFEPEEFYIDNSDLNNNKYGFEMFFKEFENDDKIFDEEEKELEDKKFGEVSMISLDDEKISNFF